MDNRSFVAVIGQEAATELFGTINAVGQTFSYNGYTFQVVGVLDEIGSTVAGSSDNIMIIPFTLGERLFNSKGISSFYVSASGSDSIEQAQAAVESYMDKLMSASSSSSSYSVNNQSAMLEALNESTSQLTLMLAGIAAISLLVGGIGIMNIMLVCTPNPCFRLILALAITKPMLAITGKGFHCIKIISLCHQKS